jgi:hypothetical protein
MINEEERTIMKKKRRILSASLDLKVIFSEV